MPDYPFSEFLVSVIKTSNDFNYTYEVTSSGQKSITTYNLKKGSTSSKIVTCRGLINIYINIGRDLKVVNDYYLKAGSTIDITINSNTTFQL